MLSSRQAIPVGTGATETRVGADGGLQPVSGGGSKQSQHHCHKVFAEVASSTGGCFVRRAQLDKSVRFKMSGVMSR